MAQGSRQVQTQAQQQIQTLSPQQILVVKLLELPAVELEDRVRAELLENPALEEGKEDTPGDEYPDTPDAETGSEDGGDTSYDSLSDYLNEDDIPDYKLQENNRSKGEQAEEIPFSDATSFYETLRQQLGEQDLTPHQRELAEYLIGSLDDDGLLRKDLDSICDELAIYQNIDVSEQKLEKILHILQTFDPAGIGARNLQECLLLQAKRMPKGVLRKSMEEVFTDYYDEFTKKHWDKIKTGLELNDTQLATLQEEIRKLNPKPGASLGETEGRNLQQITPDFIVDTNDDGTVTFSLNRGNMPELTVSTSFTDMIDTYKKNKGNMSRQDKEALLYAKEKVDKAQGFIEAIRQRRHTLIVTMKAIIERQKAFFLDGDEADLKPMILKDIEERTGLDKSTISRVCNMKYAQTKWGTFPLKFFFTDSYTTEDGEEMSTRKIKLALKELIEHEDKKKPLSDDALSKVLKEKGFPVARRTVAKYREQLGIPVARLRK